MQLCQPAPIFDMKTIKLSKGKETIVDDKDYEYLSQFKWYCSFYGYAVRMIYKNKKNRYIVWMHREILSASEGKQVDHINGDTLDNRRTNLRLASVKENNRNMKIPRHNTSGYKGVSFDKKKGKYRASIYVDNKQKFLGYFDDPKQASFAYDAAAIKFHKEFARTNHG